MKAGFPFLQKGLGTDVEVLRGEAKPVGAKQGRFLNTHLEAEMLLV